MFPFFSISTLRRTLSNLEKWNLIIVGNHNKMKSDQTKWYTVNYDKVREIDDNPELLVKPKRKNREAKIEPSVENDSPCVQNEQANCSKWTGHVTNLNKPLPKTPTKTPSKVVEREKNPINLEISEQTKHENSSLEDLLTYANECFMKNMSVNLFVGEIDDETLEQGERILKLCKGNEKKFRILMERASQRWYTCQSMKEYQKYNGGVAADPNLGWFNMRRGKQMFTELFKPEMVKYNKDKFADVGNDSAEISTTS